MKRLKENLTIMFDYSLSHWATFFSAAFLLNISPGPDLAFILGQTAKGGIKAGIYAMFGIWTGAFMHVILAALGLSAVLATSVIAFSMVKWFGAAYLVWLGIQAFRSKGANISVNDSIPSKGLIEIFRQGIMVAILNPKVAVFFLAFLPQFVEPELGPVSAQFFLHGILIIMVAGFVEPPLILVGGQLTTYLNKNNNVSRWIDRGFGTILIGLALKLAIGNQGRTKITA